MPAVNVRFLRKPLQSFNTCCNRRTRYGVLLLTTVLTLLTACVSIDNKLSLITNAHASANTLQHCEPVLDAEALSTSVSTRQGLDPNSIAFLNWNIYKGNEDNWQQDLTRFASEHNVMTLQEAMLETELTDLIEAHEMQWVMNRAFQLNGVAAGVMTVADSDAIYSCGFKNAEPLIRIPKATLVSYYNIDGSGERLLVANIHGINFTLGMEDYRQQIDDLYIAVKHHKGPMIIAGDFNSWSDERMAELGTLIEKLELSNLEYSVNNRTHILGNAIDHVFYRQLEPVRNRVWEVSSSDHNPISVQFRYKRNTGYRTSSLL